MDYTPSATKLSAIEDRQRRIDLIAADLNAGTNQFADVTAWILAELLGLDWQSPDDFHQVSLAHAPDPGQDEPTVPELIQARAKLTATDGTEVRFEAFIGNDGEHYDIRGPYDYARGHVADMSRYIEMI